MTTWLPRAGRGQRLVACVLRRGRDVEFAADQERLDGVPMQMLQRCASAGRGLDDEHPGARVSVTETLIGRACQQPRFAESDVRHSRRMTA